MISSFLPEVNLHKKRKLTIGIAAVSCSKGYGFSEYEKETAKAGRLRRVTEQHPHFELAHAG